MKENENIPPFVKKYNNKNICCMLLFERFSVKCFTIIINSSTEINCKPAVTITMKRTPCTQAGSEASLMVLISVSLVSRATRLGKRGRQIKVTIFIRKSQIITIIR